MSEQCGRHEDLVRRVEELEAQSASIGERVNKLEHSNGITEDRMERIFADVEELKASIKTIAEKLDLLIQRPGKKWDGAIDKIIAVLVAAAVAYFIGGKQ